MTLSELSACQVQPVSQQHACITAQRLVACREEYARCRCAWAFLRAFPARCPRTQPQDEVMCLEPASTGETQPSCRTMVSGNNLELPALRLPVRGWAVLSYVLHGRGASHLHASVAS